MSEETKDFHISDVLSIATPYLLSTRHMEGVYDILNWMTRDTLFTHQLGRAAKECRPWLLRQHPQLAEIEPWAERAMKAIPEDAPSDARTKLVRAFVDAVVAKYGSTLPVRKIPQDDHEHKHPLDELREMRPDITPIVIEAD